MAQARWAYQPRLARRHRHVVGGCESLLLVRSEHVEHILLGCERLGELRRVLKALGESAADHRRGRVCCVARERDAFGHQAIGRVLGHRRTEDEASLQRDAERFRPRRGPPCTACDSSKLVADLLRHVGGQQRSSHDRAFKEPVLAQQLFASWVVPDKDEASVTDAYIAIGARDRVRDEAVAIGVVLA